MATAAATASACPTPSGSKARHTAVRLAVVTDKDWMRHGIAAFGWLIPGEIRVFDPGELEQAKAWTGGAG